MKYHHLTFEDSKNKASSVRGYTNVSAIRIQKVYEILGVDCKLTDESSENLILSINVTELSIYKNGKLSQEIKSCNCDRECIYNVYVSDAVSW